MIEFLAPQKKTGGLFKKMSTVKPYTCEYCGSSFTKEKTLSVHMCEKKRRRLQKDEKRVQTGYYAFKTFVQVRTTMLLLSLEVLLAMYVHCIQRNMLTM